MARCRILELVLDNGFRTAKITCAAELIPSPGQYLLAGDASDSPLPVSVFAAESTLTGFLAAPPVPDSWNPGQELFLHGPLGHGFELPASARNVALVAFDDSPVRLRGLIQPALKQSAGVVVVSDFAYANLPDEVEVQPLAELPEVLAWADYVAWDVRRENLLELKERLGKMKQGLAWSEAQARTEPSRSVLIRTPMPCGGVAECGVCAVSVKSGWKMACKEGPVFPLPLVLEAASSPPRTAA